MSELGLTFTFEGIRFALEISVFQGSKTAKPMRKLSRLQIREFF